MARAAGAANYRSARVVVHGSPAGGRPLPDEGEPAGLLGLAASGERPSRRRKRRVRAERAQGKLLEAKLLNRPAVLEVMLAERLLDGRDARTRAVLGHEGDARVVDGEVTREVAAVECLDRGCERPAD